MTHALPICRRQRGSAARRALVNIVGCCLSGANARDRRDYGEGAAAARRGAATASLLGRTERTDALTATMLNCLASAAYSFDDTHAETILHPSSATATALLALSEQRPMTGEAFLVALRTGYRRRVACEQVGVRAARGWRHRLVADGHRRRNRRCSGSGESHWTSIRSASHGRSALRRCKRRASERRMARWPRR